MQQFKKEEVELIILSVTSNGECVIKMKIYKNGTTCRIGVGGLPEIGLDIMSFVNDQQYFDPIMENITQEMLDQPIDYQEPIPNGYLEYAIVFFGVSRNGETGERADWQKMTGSLFKTDFRTNFQHPIRIKIDRLVTDAAELTNELYFDAFMQVVYKARSSKLPAQTMISAPKTNVKLREDFVNYVRQMIASERKWDMSAYVKNKSYYIDDVAHRAFVFKENGRFRVNFIPEENDEFEFGSFE